MSLILYIKTHPYHCVVDTVYWTIPTQELLSNCFWYNNYRHYPITTIPWLISLSTDILISQIHVPTKLTWLLSLSLSFELNIKLKLKINWDLIVLQFKAASIYVCTSAFNCQQCKINGNIQLSVIFTCIG